MFNEIEMALKNSLRTSSDHIIEYHYDEYPDSKEWLDELVKHSVLKFLTPQELHENYINLKYLEVRAEFLLSVIEDKYILEPTEEGGEVIEREVSNYFIYQFNCRDLFTQVARMNKFQIASKQLFNSNVYFIGEMIVGGKKIAWFYSDSFTTDLLATLISNYDFLILSTSKKFTVDYQYEGRIFKHLLTMKIETWDFDIGKIINKKNGFDVEDLVKKSKKDFIVDLEEQRIFLFEREIAKKESRNYMFVMGLVKASKQGVSKDVFKKYLLIAPADIDNFREIIKKDRQQLKVAINKIFSDSDELKIAAFKIFNVDKKIGKSELEQINLEKNEIIYFL